jgi:hypothetical protein
MTVVFEVEIETFGDPATYDEEIIAELPGTLAKLGGVGAVATLGGVAGGPGAAFGLQDASSASHRGSLSSTLRAGLAVFEKGCRELGIAHEGFARVSVVADDMLQRELAQQPETYLGVTEVARELGVSRQRLSELRTRRDFPAPVAELAAGPVWRASTLLRFIEDWERKPGRPRKRASIATG